MVSLNHLSVFPRGLRLQLNEDPVEVLRHLLSHQPSLAIGNERLHWAEVSDPPRHDGLDEVDATAAGKHLAGGPADCFVEQMANHDLAVEQDVPLHNVVKVASHSRGGHRLWSRL